MKTQMLRFYVSSTDVVEHISVYEAIAYAAKRYGLMGCTIYKGIMGYGSSSKLHSDKFWELNTKFPVTVEIVDDKEKLDGFIEEIKQLIETLPKGCLLTRQDVDIVIRKIGKQK
jgi:uncharacterized protein